MKMVNWIRKQISAGKLNNVRSILGEIFLFQHMRSRLTKTFSNDVIIENPLSIDSNNHRYTVYKFVVDL